MHNKRFHVMGQRLQNSLVAVTEKVHAVESKTMILKKEVQLAEMESGDGERCRGERRCRADGGLAAVGVEEKASTTCCFRSDVSDDL